MGGGPDVAEFVPRRPQRGQLGPVLGVGVPAPGRPRDSGLGQQRFWLSAAPSPPRLLLRPNGIR